MVRSFPNNLAGRSSALLIILAFALAGVAFGVVSASAQNPYAGWEKGGAYDRHYDVSEFDQFKGQVEDIIEITPMSGMAPGVGLVIRDESGDQVEVQIGPKGFVDLQSIALKKGDKVKVKGVWAEIDGKDVFMASKIKKGEFIEVKVRKTKDGAPFWSMTPDELAKEKESE